MKQKISRFWKQITSQKYFAHVMAFLLPFMISIGICMGIGVYPFGDQSLLHMDAYHQYGPFFMDFARNLKEGKSLLFTWNLGLGSDYLSLYAYYLASPLNWLLILVPQGHVIEFMDYMMILKVSACGFTFFYFLKDHFSLYGKDGKLHMRTVSPALACSTAYALCGFVAAYSWDIMWMDSVALAPLVFLGIDRMLHKGQVKMYYFALAVSIFSNYYISIMICIFAVFYFAAMWLPLKKGKVIGLVRFSVYSLLAGGTSAVLILPEIAILGVSGSSAKGFPEQMKWYFSLVEVISRGCMTETAYKGNDHWPNIYVGCFAFLLVLLYILNKRISVWKKISRVGMVIFFLISFCNNYLDFIWHGMHFPQGLPGRQSFLFAFLVLCMCFDVCRMWKGTRLWHIFVALVVDFALLIAGYLKADFAITEQYAFFATLGFILAYAILMVVLCLVNNRQKIFLRRFIFLIVMVELIVNMAMTGYYSSNRTIYVQKMQSYDKLLTMAKLQSDSKEFYRIEDTERKTKNDSALYGYASTTIFSSLMNRNVSQFYQRMYMEGGLNYYCYNGATPLTSAILSVKYTLSDSAFEESALRKLVGGSGGQYLYENNYYLPLGFMMTEEAVEAFDMEYASGKITRLNNLTKALGAGTAFYSASNLADVTEEESVTTYTFHKSGYYYVAHTGCDVDSLDVTNQNSGFSKTYSKTTHNYLIELGYCEEGDVVTIKNHGYATVGFNLYSMDINEINKAYATLSRQTMTLDQMSDTRIDGTIDVSEEGRLILSIPADEGWTLYVDGKETEIDPFKEAFIAVHLTEGIHKISLQYSTPNLAMGAKISAGSLGLFLLLLMGRFCFRKGNEKRKQKHNGDVYEQ